MKIIDLQVENVKKIKAVHIIPSSNIVGIGGMNEQGKSSVLDSIEYALAGKSSQPSRPVRDGSKKAKIVCDLDDLKITRTITDSGGGTLVVESKDGARYPSPQAVLDKLTGSLCFDPLAFSRMDNKKQLETLKKLVGLDFSAQDAERKILFDERTSINREVKNLENQFKAIPQEENVPEKEIVISELVDELSKRQNINQQNQNHKEQLKTLESSVASINKDIEELQNRLETLQKEREEIQKRITKGVKFVSSLKDQDENEIKSKISEADQINAQFRKSQERDKIKTRLDDAIRESKNKTDAIESIDSSKQSAMQSAKFPIDGLSFGDDGVLFNNIPFDQCSSAQRLKISVAMGIAMNPQLRVLLIRDGSLLDENSMSCIADMANESDMQIWIERVSTGNDVSVIIEDGEVK